MKLDTDLVATSCHYTLSFDIRRTDRRHQAPLVAIPRRYQPPLAATSRHLSPPAATSRHQRCYHLPSISITTRTPGVLQCDRTESSPDPGKTQDEPSIHPMWTHYGPSVGFILILVGPRAGSRRPPTDLDSATDSLPNDSRLNTSEAPELTKRPGLFLDGAAVRPLAHPK